MRRILGVLARLWRKRGGGWGAVGQRGERVAARYLKKRGFRVIGKNVVTPIGEADLVCVDPDGRTVVVVEVKTRVVKVCGSGGRDFGRPGVMGGRMAPELNVTAAKRRKLVAVARDLARRRGWQDRAMRIDVVGVELVEGGEDVVRHLPGAVEARG